MLLKVLKKSLKNWVILFNLLVLFSYLNADNLIITSVYPLKLVLQEIVPNEIKVINVIPSNVNPHIYEPTPSTIKNIEKAKIFIGIQKDFDGWIEKNLNKNSIVYYIHAKKLNPHIWLSPKYILNQIDNISKILEKNFPEYKKKIKENSIYFKNKLKKIIEKYRKKFNSIKNKNIIELHPAFDYLANDFSIKICGVIFTSDHAEISIKHYLKIVKKSKQYNVKIILVSSNIKSKIIKNLSQDLNAKIVKIDPLGKDSKNYFDFIKKILDKIYFSFLEINK